MKIINIITSILFLIMGLIITIKPEIFTDFNLTQHIGLLTGAIGVLWLNFESVNDKTIEKLENRITQLNNEIKVLKNEF